ncbi:hypothetical protein C8J57DRAFT_1230388 [Mycena rebaudengoi]|nr:hypothetical protein C8J57DRAFT_1230388 [Mycena rebaudengoi]
MSSIQITSPVRPPILNIRLQNIDIAFGRPTFASSLSTRGICYVCKSLLHLSIVCVFMRGFAKPQDASSSFPLPRVVFNSSMAPSRCHCQIPQQGLVEETAKSDPNLLCETPWVFFQFFNSIVSS